MKPFLTKEQAEWLIQQIDKKAVFDCPGENAEPFDAFSDGLMAQELRIKKIINQCTEKEFPGFQIDWGNQGIIVFQGTKFVIIETEQANQAVLNVKEFKQFTQGCNKIAEWLDEQE